MKTVDADIKNHTFARSYLFFGEEAYLIKQYKDKLKAAIVPEGDTMNFASYQGDAVNPKELIDLAETMPFFSGRRMILVEDSGFFKGSCDDLADYMEQVPQTTTFLFVETEIDKRSRMYKALKKSGRIVEFKKMDEKTLTVWILGRLKRENKNITQAAMREFFDRVGMDMGALDRELEKLICYCMDRDAIEKSDVEAVCPQAVTNRIFEMVDAIVQCRRGDAMRMYEDLLALREPPLRILYLITRQYNILFQIKDLKKRGASIGDMAKTVGIRDFVVKRSLSQASRLSSDTIQEILSYGIQMEEAVKTGQLNEHIAVELLILEASRERNYK